MAVEKLLNRGSKSIQAIASDLGLGVSTLWSWKRIYASIDSMKNNKRTPNSLNLNEKLKLILEYKDLTQEKQGEFLRANGFHVEHIEVWVTEIQRRLSNKNNSEESSKNKCLKPDTVCKNTAIELKDKEKALAELSALLILKKKANLLWGMGNE